MRRLFLSAGLVISMYVSLMAGSHEHSMQVLIDTDAGIDDLRAICLLLGTDEIEVLGFTTSDGMCDPLTGYQKVSSLLRFLGHEGIPVYPGNRSEGKTEPYGDLCYSVRWGTAETTVSPSTMKADQFLISILSDQKTLVTLVALGPLTNYARMLDKEPLLGSHIDRIIWYNDDINPIKGDNYSFDKESFKKILTHHIPIEIVSSAAEMELSFDPVMLTDIGQTSSLYAKAIRLAFSDSVMNQKLNAGHFGLWDDLVSIFLIYPEVFTVNQTDENNHLTQYIPSWGSMIQQKWMEILLDEADDNQVFDFFPTDTALFADDIRGGMRQIIQRHGSEEWRAVVITNELHGHLGVYAIIGTKMGLRAREYFRADHDQLEVLSHAGSSPPVSCLNDGLQVSTGATLGHGLIRIASGGPFEPCATFSFKDQSITLKLKNPYWQIIRNDIAECIRLNGNLTDEYWDCIRKLAITYWLEWDRHELFEIIESKQHTDEQ